MRTQKKANPTSPKAPRARAVAPPQPEQHPTVRAALRSTHSAWWKATEKALRTADGHYVPFYQPGSAEAVWTHAATEQVAPTDIPRLRNFFDAITSTALPATIDFRTSTGPRPHRWTRLTVVQRLGSARARSWAGVVTDITVLKKAEEELLVISEREQNRIGQDLHDDLCQVLAGLSCLTRVLENRLAPQVPHEVDSLREINRQLVETMDRTRALTHGLFPGKIQAGAPQPALLELAKQVEVRFGIKVRATFRGRIPQHSSQEILHVYRIAQEAISNAIRHGRARRVDLLLETLPGSLRLTVRDDGTGLPATQAHTPGIGLQIMRHRAEQIGATVAVSNAPKRGAQVTLQYQPLAHP